MRGAVDAVGDAVAGIGQGGVHRVVAVVGLEARGGSAFGRRSDGCWRLPSQAGDRAECDVDLAGEAFQFRQRGQRRAVDQHRLDRDHPRIRRLAFDSSDSARSTVTPARGVARLGARAFEEGGMTLVAERAALQGFVQQRSHVAGEQRAQVRR